MLYLDRTLPPLTHNLAPTSGLLLAADAAGPQQRKRTPLLQHGTLLYDSDADQAGRYLRLPPRQPEYRRQRSHRDFMANMPATAEQLKRCLRDAWGPENELMEWPQDLVR